MECTFEQKRRTTPRRRWCGLVRCSRNNQTVVLLYIVGVPWIAAVAKIDFSKALIGPAGATAFVGASPITS